MADPIRFPIEASHVMMFARAVGDPNPLFFDADAAQAAGLPGIVAPPTFGIAADHFDPHYPRRPQPGEVWFGSGAEPISIVGGSQQAAGGGSGFHAEEHFVYHRPLVVGDVLFGTARSGKSWEKAGRRGGHLRFSEDLLEYRDATGAPVLTACWVNVLTERVVAGGEAAPEPSAPRHAPEPDAQWRVCTEVSHAVFGGAALDVGDQRVQLLVEDLKRTQIVMYAGASGDFHPMHTDASYARAMGMPGVFAHGMLTMGVTGRALTDLVGVAQLADYRARFRGQVWPGDTLSAHIELGAICEQAGRRAARLELETRNQRGERVLSGRAHAWLPE